MVQKAKLRARLERLGAGKSYFGVTLGDIGDLGVGIRLYFMLTKYTSMLFVVMAVCAAPTAGDDNRHPPLCFHEALCECGGRVVLHYYGHGVTAATKDPLGLNFVSLANEGINAEYIPTNCTLQHPYTSPTFPGLHFDVRPLRVLHSLQSCLVFARAYVATICDCAYSLVFVVFIVAFSYRCHAIVTAHTRDNITPAKYAVYVRGFPRDATEQEIMTHFSALYDLSQPAHRFPMWLGPGHDENGAKLPQPVENVSHVDGNKLYVGSWVAQVSIARPIGRFLRLFLALETLTQRIAMLEATMVEYRKQERRFRKRLRRAETEFATLETQLEAKTNKMTALRTQGNQRYVGRLEPQYNYECAFIVFNHVESQRRCLADYRTSTTWWKRYFQPKDLRFRRIHPLKVTAAPEPSNIIWENLETPPVERFASAQQAFNKPGPSSICSKILDVYQGPDFNTSTDNSATSPSNSTDDWTLQWNASSRCPDDASFDITFLNHSATPFPPSVLPFNDIGGASFNLTRCTSTCFTPGLTTCGTLPCFTTDVNYTSSKAVGDDSCEAYDASSILLCYCKPKLEAYVKADGLCNGPWKLWDVELPCRAYITAFLTKNGLLIAAAITVILVNTVLRGVFYAFGTFERHSSESNKAAAVVLKLFFAQWINTAVIVLLVNANLGNVPVIQFLLAGKLTDMERGWYTSVGAGITLTMLVNVVTPHLGPLLAAYVIFPVKRTFKQFTTVTTPQMTALFANPDFDISVRYPVVLNTIFVTFMYAGGMPALLPLGAVSCYLNYAIDKLMLMKLYRVRTAYDQALGTLALQLFPWMLLVHLGFSAWAYGVSSLLQSDLLSVSALAKQATSALASVQSSLSSQDGGSSAVNSTTTGDSLEGGDDPTELLQSFLQDQLAEVADPTLADLLSGVLKAYAKIVRLNTFPLFFFFVLVLLYLLLHRVLTPLFHVTVGIVFKCVGMLVRTLGCRSGRRVATTRGLWEGSGGGMMFPGFTALFERPLTTDEMGDDTITPVTKKPVDVARGFEIDADRRVLICRGVDGHHLRSWEATAAQVKTYAIEKNPKYTVRSNDIEPCGSEPKLTWLVV
ncbi:hypothetical protein DYB26_007325 [Aphanomyces astaci]|uniref:CSC1/OSCA1-like cytosolic domain-containing protein n=1 Tax=Aphanomyces astaci TaxID=112090 RepID=A0A418FR14_APHAT|nr:hypothetical protein DYB26_007325 [Aphanomyces astaci]